MRVCLCTNVCIRRFKKLLILYRSCFLLHKSCQVVESMLTVVCVCDFYRFAHIFSIKVYIVLSVPKASFLFLNFLLE